jgi:hypothetical protein
MSTELMRLCIWLLGKEIEPPIDFATLVDQSMVEDTLTSVKEHQNNFIRKARLQKWAPSNVPADLSPAKASSSTKDSIAATFKTENDYGQAYEFLAFCKRFLQDRDRASLCILTLCYLVESKSLAIQKQKVPILFARLLDLDEKQALDLYKKHPSNFAKNFPITTQLVELRQQQTAQVSVETVTNEIQRLDDLLLHEKNLLGIIPLFHEKISNINELAALILYVLKRGVTAAQLIQSTFLHDFLDANLFTLALADNEVKQLYEILSQFKDAKDLIALASRSMAKINCPMSLLLNGDQPKSEEPVSDVVMIDTPFTFTVTRDNFKNLHTLFDNAFLVGGLQLFTRTQDNFLKELLISCINGKEDGGLTTEKIGDLIQAIAKTTPLLKSLATIIDDETVDKLLQAHKGAVFHLAYYRPGILNTLQQMDSLQNYIRALTTSDPVDTLVQLIVLLLACNKNANVEKLLYGEILNFMIENSNNNLQEDDEVSYVLKSYMPKYSKMIQQRANDLVEALKTSIQTNMLSENSFSKDAYCPVDDSWRQNTKTFSFLKQLNNNLTSDYPDNQYALYAYVVNSLVKKGIKFNLGDFLNNILPPQNEPIKDEHVSQFERALIEILATIDDPLIRESAITLLETIPRKDQQWIGKKYGDTTIFKLAAKSGNLKMVQFLLTQDNITISPKAVSEALEVAARAGQGEVVQCLCTLTTENQPNCEAVSVALVRASQTGQREVVQYLCELTTENQPNNHAVSVALEEAAQAGQWEIVQYLCAPTTKTQPNRDAVYSALKVAAKTGQCEIVQYLCALTTINQPNCQHVSSILSKAARMGQYDVVQCLCALKTANQPDCEAVSSALEEAVSAGEWGVVKDLCALTTNNKPSCEGVMEALKLARKEVHEGDQAKFIKLINCINDLRIYGKSLDFESWTKVAELAGKLARITGEYAALTWLRLNSDNQAMHDIKRRFNSLLNEGYKDVGKDRKHEELILAIADAGSELGLLFVIDKPTLAGNGFFMQTKRQKMNEIENESELENKSPSVAK